MMPQILAGLGLATALAGCEPVQSIHPFFERKDALFDPVLIGSWATKKDDGFQMRLRLEKTSPNQNEYTADLIFLADEPDEGKPKVGTVTFLVCLFHVGKLRFLDFYPSSYSASWGGHTGRFDAKENAFQTSTHTVYRVTLDEDRLRLAYLDDDHVKEFAHKKGLKVATEIDNGILLIAPTQELQSQLLAQAEEEKLLDGDGVEFVRQK